MTPKFVDLCRLTDGCWFVRCCHSAAGISDVQVEHVVLPIEVCSDGSWLVSGWPVIRFAAIFGFSPSDVPPRQFELVARYLHLLRINGCLPDIGHDGGEIVPIAEEYARRFEPILDLVKNANCSDSDTCLRSRIQHAPNTSLAGILCQNGEADLVFRFLEHCPQDVLPLAFVPLYLDIETTHDGESCFQYLSKINMSGGYARQWPFVCTHRRISINAGGAVRVRNVAIPDPHVPLKMAKNLLAGDHSKALLPEEISCSQNVCINHELKDLYSTLRSVVRDFSTSSSQHRVEIGIADPREKREHLRELVSSVLDSHARTAIKRMQTTLRLRAYPFDGLAREAAYSQFFADGANPSINQRRQQALRTMPLLTHCLAIGGFPQARQALDAATPLLPALAAELAVSSWATSRLTKLPLPEIKHAFFQMMGRQVEHIARLANYIEWLGPDCTATRDPAGAYALLKCIDDHFNFTLHDNAIRRAFGHEREDVKLLVAALGRELNKQGRTGAGDLEWLRDLADNALPTSLYFSVARATIRHHLEAKAVKARDVEPILAEWQTSLSAGELMEKAQRVATLCRLHRGKEMSEWLREGMTESVEEVIPAYTCIETGVQVVPLVTRLELANEGRRMHHCVGGYWGRVASGKVLLFSLHDPQASRDATLCLSKVRNGAWKIEEFKGRENADIHEPRFLLAADRLCERLSSWTRTMSSSAHPGIAVGIAPGAALGTQTQVLDLPIQSFPENVQSSLLALYPGAGSLDRRIEVAQRKIGQSRVC